jgi:hypothetical protein
MLGKSGKVRGSLEKSWKVEKLKKTRLFWTFPDLLRKAPSPSIRHPASNIEHLFSEEINFDDPA